MLCRGLEIQLVFVGIHCGNVTRMSFTVAISVGHIIPMMETADFIDSSFVFATHRLYSPLFDVYVLWLQVSYTDCIIGVSLCNIPVFTFIGGRQ